MLAHSRRKLPAAYRDQLLNVDTAISSRFRSEAAHSANIEIKDRAMSAGKIRHATTTLQRTHQCSLPRPMASMPSAVYRPSMIRAAHEVRRRPQSPMHQPANAYLPSRANKLRRHAGDMRTSIGFELGTRRAAVIDI